MQEDNNIVQVHNRRHMDTAALASITAVTQPARETVRRAAVPVPDVCAMRGDMV